MALNPRTKGADGELEFCSRFQPFFSESLKRNLLQSREGGADITGSDPWVVEVKRCQLVEHNKWWRQVKAAVTEEWQIPVVAYRVNFGAWLFLIPSSMLGLEHEGYVLASEDVWLQLVIKQNGT